MWFLSVFTLIAICVQIVFITVAIAAGLYYLAELVEEYSYVAKKIIAWMNMGVIGLLTSLWIFEGFPLFMITCEIVAHLLHFVILKSFPVVSLGSPEFIVGILFVVFNHYLAFSYFASYYYSFSEVLAYFTLCLWLIPFSLFVSLSANDNVLPTTSERIDGDVLSNYFSKRKKYGLLSFFNYAKESILPMRSKKGF